MDRHMSQEGYFAAMNSVIELVGWIIVIAFAIFFLKYQALATDGCDGISEMVVKWSDQGHFECSKVQAKWGQNQKDLISVGLSIYHHYKIIWGKVCQDLSFNF